MDVAWLILDSVSWNSTPFSKGGPETMPQLEHLAENRGVVFSQCYVSGVASPGSHSSFLTGQYPSKTGYHRGYYNYDGAYPTVAEAINRTHTSILVTQNQYVLGLGESFDTVVDVGESHEKFIPFSEATNPDVEDDLQQYGVPQRYIEFVKRDGKPIRSIINGLFYKYQERMDDSDYADAATEKINSHIRSYMGNDSPKFILANYMGAHPPFKPTKKAINEFDDGSKLENFPIGETLPYRTSLDSTKFDPKEVTTLYHASIWDLDRKVTPLIEELLEKETIVFVFADHGTCVDYGDPLSDLRTHVPLLIFAPNKGPSSIAHTVNLRNLASTTTSLLSEYHGDINALPGTNLLSIDESDISITEYIHYGKDGDPPASNSSIANANQDLVYCVSARIDDSRVDYYDHNERYDVIRGNEATTSRLKAAIKDHIRKVENGERPEGNESTTYDIDEERLRRLGYLE